MPKGYTHLTPDDRCQIEVLLKRGDSKFAIGRLLGRPASTIRREIARNAGLRGYRKRQAQLVSSARRSAASQRAKKMTAGVIELEEATKAKLLQQVRNFTTFNKSNDPHEEHDFGSVEIEGQNYFWKIDYYNLSLDGGSKDPANPAVTTRVLTVMRSDEY